MGSIRAKPQKRGADSSPPASNVQLSPASLETLLGWLDSDREKAAEKYEAIRKRLIKLFGARGFNNPEELADHTFDKVAARVPQLIGTYLGDPVAYFSGVAKAVMGEAVRQSVLDVKPAAIFDDENVSNQMYSCLDKCLTYLSESNRDVIRQYYMYETQSKVARRVAQARNLGLSPNALRIRIHRLRQSLRKCVESCVQEEEQINMKGMKSK